MNGLRDLGFPGDLPLTIPVWLKIVQACSKQRSSGKLTKL